MSHRHWPPCCQEYKTVRERTKIKSLYKDNNLYRKAEVGSGHLFLASSTRGGKLHLLGNVFDKTASRDLIADISAVHWQLLSEESFALRHVQFAHNAHGISGKSFKCLVFFFQMTNLRDQYASSVIQETWPCTVTLVTAIFPTLAMKPNETDGGSNFNWDKSKQWPRTRVGGWSYLPCVSGYGLILNEASVDQ